MITTAEKQRCWHCRTWVRRRQQWQMDAQQPASHSQLIRSATDKQLSRQWNIRELKWTYSWLGCHPSCFTFIAATPGSCSLPSHRVPISPHASHLISFASNQNRLLLLQASVLYGGEVWGRLKGFSPSTANTGSVINGTAEILNSCKS